MNRILYLDGVRGLAIVLLLVGHFLTTRGVNFGRLGVELFFVLSGRLMAEILFVDRCDIGLFYRRRISRVWPAMLVFIAVAWAGLAGTQHAFGWGDALAASTFVINYQLAAGQSLEAIEHIWSLCVEEHTYVLLTGVALLHRRFGLRPAPVCAGLALACIVNGAIQTTVLDLGYRQVYWRTDVRAASILLSAAMWLWLRGRTWPAWLPVTSLAAGFALNLQVVPDQIKYSVGTACLSFAVIAWSSTGVRLVSLLQHPMLLHLGLWSFSIYLWQQPFKAFNDPAQRALLPLLLAGTFAAALASYYLIEEPARRFLNRHWKPKAADRAPTPVRAA